MLKSSLKNQVPFLIGQYERISSGQNKLACCTSNMFYDKNEK